MFLYSQFFRTSMTQTSKWLISKPTTYAHNFLSLQGLEILERVRKIQWMDYGWDRFSFELCLSQGPSVIMTTAFR